jgi:Ran GTPase-activating protein (RanGAP) involved in mRNA processing and transport
MKKYNKSKEIIENSWIKLESIFDVPMKNSGKVLHRKHESLYNQKPKGRRSPNDSPELTVRASTPSTYFHKNATSLQGITSNQLKLLYHAKCEDLDIPVLPDQQFRFFSFCSRHFSNRRFEMQESGLGFISSTIIGEILAANSFFAFIILGKNMLGDSGCVNLTKFIQRSLTIVHLDLSSNNLTPEGAEQVLKILSGHGSLASLDLSSHEGLHRNRLAMPGSSGVKFLLMKSQVITHINVSGTTVREGLKMISEGVFYCRTLASLQLANNSIQGEYLKSLCSSLNSGDLALLDLANNPLGGEGAEHLSQFLAGNPPLASLDISYAGITGKGFHSLFVALPNNSHLVYLNLAGNLVGGRLSDEVIYMLTLNGAIHTLDLSACLLKNSSTLVLAQGLARNRGVRILKLCRNGISDSGAEGLAAALISNTFIKIVDLSCNKIKDEGAEFIGKIFSYNSTLEDLNLKENLIKDKGALSINDTILSNPGILHINLELNHVSCKVIDQIQEKLKTNQMKRKKSSMTSAQRQTKVVQFDENSIKKIMERVNQKKREKDEIKGKIDKNLEKFEEIKNQESLKMLALKQNLQELAEKNKKLSQELEESQRNCVTARIGFEKEINSWKKKHEMIDAEIKNLILKSKD